MEHMAEEGENVTLNVYDLSQGLARQLSVAFLGKSIEAIWHTGVVVYGNEYYFGAGIHHDPVGSTPYGKPIHVVDLGVTRIPKEVFEDFLREISLRYSADTYKLLTHNCNNFSNEVAQFLVGTTIPNHILQLPNEVMNSPMAPLILPMIQQLETTMRSGAVPRAPQFDPSFSRPEKSTVPMPKKLPQEAAEKPAEQEKKEVGKDLLGEARNKVQEEITREFAAIMATGTLRASEAAALATRKVMERHRGTNVLMQ
ncbi:DeSI-like protein [Apostasia shenzhenica]|uniref:DeSI-like protein n=1 Tax=Apostasia shenzhenica TaxID=1088818 RepID=A0A2I0ADW9_9ASPA|nr:DeSI-like protein [Apostasia shenzhenica]